MDRTFQFSFRRRVQVVSPPILVALGLAGLLAWRGHLASWKTWVVLGVIALLAFRVITYLIGGRRAVVISDEALVRSGRSIGFAEAEVELRTLPKGKGLAVNEVVLWRPGRHEGVGFDHSLADFERAAKAVIEKVSEERVVVSAPGEKDIRDGRREEILAPFRTTPIERAMAELGPAKVALPKPPHLRS